REGAWNGTQIVAPEWVHAATTRQIRTGDGGGYGYQWWTLDAVSYTALGYQGQYIMVLPDDDLVVVFTSSLTLQTSNEPVNLLNRYILPAVQSADPLPENPAGEAALAAQVATAASGFTLPTTATLIDGLTYTLSDNDLGWEAVTLRFDAARRTAQLSINDAAAITIGLGPPGRIASSEQLGLAPAGVPVTLQGSWEDTTTFVLTGDPVLPTAPAFNLRFVFAGAAAFTLQGQILPDGPAFVSEGTCRE
ncbi:MAG: hypothetical protein JW910_14435, partial [Anaerolineae bacterium]|nr:hypothetical protein [Anaerolineae bacterium]